jgi:hypothetical protein
MKLKKFIRTKKYNFENFININKNWTFVEEKSYFFNFSHNSDKSAP